METRYTRLGNDKKHVVDQISNNMNQSDTAMQVLAKKELKEGAVSYIHDNIGLHRVENASAIEPAMTLHLNIPPYDHFHSYEEQTGRVNNTIQMTFHTMYGEHKSEH